MNPMTMKLTKLTFVLVLSLFFGFSSIAQNEEGVISTINDYSLDKVEFNPNGIKMLALDNTLMLEFNKNISYLKFEVINRKGELLLTKKDVDIRRSQLNISRLGKGTYYVRVYSDEVRDLLKFSVE